MLYVTSANMHGAGQCKSVQFAEDNVQNQPDLIPRVSNCTTYMPLSITFDTFASFFNMHSTYSHNVWKRSYKTSDVYIRWQVSLFGGSGLGGWLDE